MELIEDIMIHFQNWVSVNGYDILFKKSINWSRISMTWVMQLHEACWKTATVMCVHFILLNHCTFIFISQLWVFSVFLNHHSHINFKQSTFLAINCITINAFICQLPDSPLPRSLKAVKKGINTGSVADRDIN